MNTNTTELDMITKYYNFRQALEVGGDLDTTHKIDDRAHAPVLGIDVSHHQGDIDWGRVACHLGTPGFVYVKATEGMGYVDRHFGRNVDEASAVGLDVGAYHFARVDSGRDAERDAEREVEEFYTACERRGRGPALNLPPVIDLELGGIKGRGAEYTRRWLRSAVASARDLFGRTPTIYTGYWTWRYMGRPDEFDGLDLWLANYTNRATPRVQLGGWSDALKIWQYTGAGTIPGIRGKVDRNRWMGTTWGYRRWRRGAPVA